MPRSSEIYDAAVQEIKKIKKERRKPALEEKRRKKEKAAEFAKHCKFLEETLKPVLDNLEQNRGISIGKISFAKYFIRSDEFRRGKRESSIACEVSVKISHGLKKETLILKFELYLPEASTIKMEIPYLGIKRNRELDRVDEFGDEIKILLKRKLIKLMLK